MKAVIKEKRGEGFVNLLDVSEPESASDGYLLIRVGFAGICGSDLMIFHDRFPNYTVPVIMGHEFSGTVEEVPTGEPAFSVGDRVVCETHAYVCNNCYYCRTGRYNLCPDRKGFGYGLDGAFTKYVRVRRPIVHSLPEGISLEEGAVIEPTAVVLNALTVNSSIRPGESVIIFGPGPIGLLSLQVAKLAGAKVTVVGTKRSRARLDFASNMLGAEQTLLQLELDEKCNNRFDLAVIATGSPDSFAQALNSVKKLGRVVHIGESTDEARFQFSLIERKNLTVQGSFSHNWPVWERALGLVREGKIKVAPLISQRLDISNWKEAFEMAESKRAVKVLMHP